MRFTRVAIESIAHVIPPEPLRSDEIEARLEPLYNRLNLPQGRLELMTGIRERRFWPEPVAASWASAQAGTAALAKSAIPAEEIDLLLHCAVCRDHLEPATASTLHRLLNLPRSTQIFDVSNACLGFLNGMVLAAGLIESGQIRAALVCAGEDGRPLLEWTIAHLNNTDLSRSAIKPYFANLTIGAGAVAAVITSTERAPESPRLAGGISETDTQANDLCKGNQAFGGLEMQTASEELLEAGIALAQSNWTSFLDSNGWNAATPDRFICHQVGRQHRSRLYEALQIPLERDYSTFERLGNVGSVSLPLTLSEAIERKAVQRGQQLALLGIGSGLSSMMLAVSW